MSSGHYFQTVIVKDPVFSGSHQASIRIMHIFYWPMTGEDHDPGGGQERGRAHRQGGVLQHAPEE